MRSTLDVQATLHHTHAYSGKRIDVDWRRCSGHHGCLLLNARCSCCHTFAHGCFQWFGFPVALAIPLRRVQLTEHLAILFAKAPVGGTGARHMGGRFADAMKATNTGTRLSTVNALIACAVPHRCIEAIHMGTNQLYIVGPHGAVLVQPNLIAMFRCL